jgi:hypothetical protein
VGTVQNCGEGTGSRVASGLERTPSAGHRSIVAVCLVSVSEVVNGW